MKKALIIDDERLARSELKKLLADHPEIVIVGEAVNAKDGLEKIETLHPDLLFLDIQMPKITGIDFLKNLSNPPLVIFTTAFPEYAIEGYELNVMDYLLKPISFERFFKSVLKVQAYLSLRLRHEVTQVENYFFIKSNQKIEKVLIEDILYVEALSNYVILYTKNKKHIVYMSFKGMESQLPEGLFIKIHKSYIVAVNAIQTIDNNEVILADHILPISKSYRTQVMQRIERNLFKRL